jgi:hypothetical protein
MSWSSFDAETNRHMVEQAGCHVVSATEETAMEDEDEVTFLYVVAPRPSTNPGLALPGQPPPSPTGGKEG